MYDNLTRFFHFSFFFIGISTPAQSGQGLFNQGSLFQTPQTSGSSLFPSSTAQSTGGLGGGLGLSGSLGGGGLGGGLGGTTGLGV